MARILKIFGMLLTALLSLLGYACGGGGNGGLASAYGTPSATYKAKGVLVSELDDSPIEGISAELKRKHTISTAYTDSEGFFFLKGEEFPHQILCIELIDVDGEVNGSFVRMEIEADYTNKTFTGGSGWHRGEAEIDLGIIKMKPE